MMTLWKSFGSASICALGLSLAVPAMAEPMLADAAQQTVVVANSDTSRVVRHRQVRYGDLDLASAEGKATLERRVRLAASTVCDGKNVMNTHSPFAYLRCYDAALGDARAQLGERIALQGGGGRTAAR